MCEPATIMAVSGGIQAGQAVLGHMGAEAQADAQDARFEQNRLNVSEATALNYEADQLQLQQAREAATREKSQVGTDALKARSSARVAAGESGVTGMSVDALVDDIYGQEGRFKEGVDRDLEFDTQSAALNRKNIEITGRSQINSVRRGQRPSLLATALQIGGTAASTYVGMQGASSSPGAKKGP